MASEYHLTKLDNRDEDRRINQGRKFSLILKVPGDKRGYLFNAQIRRTYDSSSSLAVFNSENPSYDSQLDITSVVIYLTKSQTRAIPLPDKVRATASDAKAGVNVWVWDASMTSPSDNEDSVAIVSYSWVEIIPEVTR